MKRLIGIFLCLFGVFLMSHNVGAASLNLNNLNGFTTTLTGIGNTQGNIRFQNVYSFTGSGNYLYINGGTFSDYSVNWVYGHKYQIILVVSVDATGADFIIPNAISVSGDNYHTEKDTIESSVSCSSSCKYTVIHTIDIIADNTGSELVKISRSNILNLRSSSGSVNGKFNLTTIIFDNVDEAMAFRSNLMNKLNDINSDTTDIVDTLGEINDKLEALDNNAEQNQQAWDNMQNTDGLVDIGDDSQALSIVGSLNNVLGQVRDIPAAAACTINANFAGRINLGDLNFCTGKETLGSVVAFSATVIFLFISFFIVLRIIKKVIRLISWCRKN